MSQILNIAIVSPSFSCSVFHNGKYEHHYFFIWIIISWNCIYFTHLLKVTGKLIFNCELVATACVSMRIRLSTTLRSFFDDQVLGTSAYWDFLYVLFDFCCLCLLLYNAVLWSVDTLCKFELLMVKKSWNISFEKMEVALLYSCLTRSVPQIRGSESIYQNKLL